MPVKPSFTVRMLVSSSCIAAQRLLPMFASYPIAASKLRLPLFAVAAPAALLLHNRSMTPL
jgi:hypothetical protein